MYNQNVMEEFIKKYLPYAQETEAKTGISAIY